MDYADVNKTSIDINKTRSRD